MSMNEFQVVFESEDADQACIDLISNDPNEQKQQLQIALGLRYSDIGRIKGKHANKRLLLQEALIKIIKDKSFLSSVLRDFILRPCDGGQTLCPDAYQTVRLLMDAGADPNEVDFDPNYKSPGLKFCENFKGKTCYELVTCWKLGDADKFLVNKCLKKEEIYLIHELEKNLRVETDDPEILLTQLIHMSTRYIKLMQQDSSIDPRVVRLTYQIVHKLLEQYSSIAQMSDLFNTVKMKYFGKINELHDEHPDKFLLQKSHAQAINFIDEFLQDQSETPEKTVSILITICARYLRFTEEERAQQDKNHADLKSRKEKIAAQKIIHQLMGQFSTLDEMEEFLFEKAKNVYLSDEDDESHRELQKSFVIARHFIGNQVKHYKKLGGFFKSNLGDRFDKELRNYLSAFIDQTATDEDCIDLISEDPEIQKMQLQIALGVSIPNARITGGDRIGLNQRIKLQKALIARLETDKENIPFLTSLLRDFILRPCDTGQQPCPHASETVRLLMEAGADPNFDYIDADYRTPFISFLRRYAGLALHQLIEIWMIDPQKCESQWQKSEQNEREAILEELNKNQSPYVEDDPQLYMLNIFVCRNHSTELIPITGVNGCKNLNELAQELLENGLTVVNMPEQFNAVKEKYFPQLDALDDDDKDKKDIVSAFKRAQALMLETIYKQEHAEELSFLKIIKRSLYFSPLILPLIFTGIVAIVRAIKMKNTEYTVTAEDMSLDRFKKKVTKDSDIENMKLTYAMKFPVKADHLRKVVVFKEDLSHQIPNYWEYKNIFNGTTKLGPKDEAKLTKDVRVYRAR